MAWYVHFLAVLVGVVMPGLALRRHRSASSVSSPPAEMNSPEKIAAYWGNAVTMVLLALVATVAWRFGGGEWDRLGLAWPSNGVPDALMLAAAGLGLFALDTAWHLTGPRWPQTVERWHRDTPFMPATPRELRHSMAMVTGAAVGEEIVYRGFLIGYLLTLAAGGAWTVPIAVGLPAVIFGLSHLYQGGIAALKITAFSVIFGLMVIASGSVWIVVLLHFVLDVVGMFVGLRIMNAR